jgi:putative DNA primase/helicase
MIESLLRPEGRPNSTALSDLSDLIGKRFVTTSETEEGARLSESMIKQLTGMGQVKSCRKYENPITFLPTF